MNQDFITILQQLIAEQGKEALFTPARCKALLADYAKGECKKERRLLLQALEAGTVKAIDATEELELCKKQQVRNLQEELFLTEEAAADMVDTLALVLRGDNKSVTVNICSNCGKEIQKDFNSCPYCSMSVTDTVSQFNVWAANPSISLPSNFYFVNCKPKVRVIQTFSESPAGMPTEWIINRSGSSKYLFPNPNFFDQFMYSFGLYDLYMMDTERLKAKGLNKIKIIEACEILESGFIKFKGKLDLL